MNFAVLVFPGSTCDIESYKAASQLGEPVDYVWHTETDLSKYDCIIIPGGASYGDALRSGAIAAKSPIMKAVAEEAKKGKYVLGVGNGFQILLESGLLPGAVLKNVDLKFRCHSVVLAVENNDTPFTTDYKLGEAVSIPIAHSEGNYYCDEDQLAKLKANNQIVFRYKGENPNGSLDDIAGICNEERNVLGMMPRPERAIDQLLGSEDGKRMFTSILKSWREKHDATVTIG